MKISRELQVLITLGLLFGQFLLLVGAVYGKEWAIYVGGAVAGLSTSALVRLAARR